MAPVVPLPPGGVAWDETLDLVATDGARLRGALWHGGPRGLVLVLHGRTEFLEKYAVPAAQLRRRGFAVASLDWRGQGLSARAPHLGVKGHVASFDDYRRDLAALIADPAVVAVPGPRVVLAHSMAAPVAVRAILSGLLAPAAAVLTGPMFGIALGPGYRRFGPFLAALARRTRQHERWPPVPSPHVPHVLAGFEGNMLTSDREMFDWFARTLAAMPTLQLAMPTLGWFDAAFAEMRAVAGARPLGVPALCLVGTEDRVIDRAAARAQAARLGARLVEIAGARHEVLVEAEPMRGHAWAAIDHFLDNSGL